MMNKMSFLKVALSGIMMLLLSSNVVAAMVTYTFTGTGSGAVGSMSFSDADFVITASGNTNNLESYSIASLIVHDMASIYISGLGDFTFITETSTFVSNGKNIVGFSQSAGGDLFNGPINSAFSNWGLDTSIGPITGFGELLQWDDPFQPEVITTGGRIYFIDDINTAATFQASVVPVPAAVWLFGSGLLALMGITRVSKQV